MKLRHKLLITAFLFSYVKVSYCQDRKVDTIFLKDALLLNIKSERLHVFKDANKDAYNSTLTFKKNDTTISVNYRGQFPLYLDKHGDNSLITIGNTLNCYVKTGKQYSVRLTKQCNNQQLKYTYYYYFARFDDKDCSTFTISVPNKSLSKKSLFYYNHFFVDWGNQLYKIQILNCTDKIE